MRFALALLTLLAVSTGVRAAETYLPIAYVISPERDREGLAALHVSMRFKGSPSGTTQVRLPDEWGGETVLYGDMADLSATNAELLPADGNEPFIRTLQHEPGAMVALSWRFMRMAQEPEADGRNPYRVIVRPDYFHLIGFAAFAWPMIDGPYALSVSFEGFDPDLPLATSFGEGRAFAFTGQDNAAVQRHLAVGGDFRISSRDLNGKTLRVAVRGAWKFDDAALASMAADIIAGHHRFLETPTEDFLVTLLPLTDEKYYSLGGTALDGTFAMFATDHAALGDFRYLIAHEHLHKWFPDRLGGFPQGFDPTQPMRYWFSEGFTDYYTWRRLLADGVISVDEFASGWNAMLFAYGSSPARLQPNEEVGREFWSDSFTQKIPYQRGMMLAAMWDHRLRSLSSRKLDIDDVILAMQRRAQDGAVPPADALFPAVYSELSEISLADDLVRYIATGEAILLPDDLFSPCLRVETSDVPVLDFGFDADASRETNIVTGVRPLGPAARAGMRDGMRILDRRHSGPPDSRRDLHYVVDDGGTVRDIIFKPAGDETFTLQQLTAGPEADEAACRTLLGGD
ncbi:MAG TPA: hypothetical protein PL096_05140 [Micropepsaceae bacterium]|nr:hypothetical protein [Micropepsaceae bacterium]